jgi:hypothetical protein
MILFVAKSSPERTRVPRRVTDRLTVRRLVNINPGRPRTSSTATPRKPQHHHLRSPRSESKSFFFLKQVHGVKRANQEAGEGGGVAAPTRRARRGTTPAPARGGEAAPAQGGAAARGARACYFSKCSRCLLSSEDAPPSFRESWKGGLSYRGPTTQSSAVDDRDGLCLQDQYLGWGAGERSAPPPPVYDDDDGSLDVSGSGSGSDSDSDSGSPLAATTSA